MIGSIIKKIVGSKNERELKRLQPLVEQINALEPRMQALSYAILAPNPHNRQPWLVDLQVDGQVTLYVDQTRLLPHTDPFSRQIVAGLAWDQSKKDRAYRPCPRLSARPKRWSRH